MRSLSCSLLAAGILASACSSPAPLGDPAPVSDSGVVSTCGTAGAAKCGIGEACSSPVMCATGNCVSNRCATSSCTDSKKDGDETGVDCGGSCVEKCDGEACTAPSGCKSHLCAGGKCEASGTKTCGVGTSVLCSNGAECGVSADCSSDVCTQNGLCAAPGADVHRDGTRNAGETGVDCGGSVASTALCAAGQGCKASTDCEGVCPVGGVCAAPSATDGKKNQGETDTDCGGPNAPSCAIAKSCITSADCTLKYCAAGNVCAVPTGTDGIKNGGETDVDCGGAAVVEGAQNYTAPRCASDKLCAVDVDCTGAVCGENLHCAEAPSCRPIHGGQTCGTGEYGVAGSVHESCCKSLPVPGVTMKDAAGVTRQVYLDKYEITAGRIHSWIADIRRQYAGAPNVQAWITTRVAGTAGDKILEGYFPEIDPAVAGSLRYVRDLPAGDHGQPALTASGSARQFKVLPSLFTKVSSEFYRALEPGGSLYPPTPQCPNADNCYVTRDMGLFHQVGPTSNIAGITTTGTNGCSMYTGDNGHRTVGGRSSAFAAYFGEPTSATVSTLTTDEKSANCMIPIMYAAFCAWDGGYMMSREALIGAYGARVWPWGDSPTLTPYPNTTAAEASAFPGNFNINNSFSTARAPKYLFPVVAYASFANDATPFVGAPGRFPGDIASVTRPGTTDSWMDLGANMLEWSFEAGVYYASTGASFEGHILPRRWVDVVNPLHKYGKGGTRCMRLK